MENLRFAIGAGETKVFVKGGRYFEILASDGPVTLAFYDENGSQNNDATNVLSGTYLEDRFSQFDITSPTAQTVEVLLTDGKGGTRRQPGVVSITNAVASGVSTVNAAVGAAVGFALDATIIAPGTNTKGLRIRGASLFGRAGVGGLVRIGLVAAPSAPASEFPAVCLPIQYLLTADSNNIAQRETGAINIQLPAGWGLYVTRAHEAVASTYAQVVVSYEVL